MTTAQQYAPAQDYAPDPYEQAAAYDAAPPAYADASTDPSMGGEVAIEAPEGVTDENPVLDSASAVESGQGSFMPPAEENAGDALMTAADEDLSVVDQEASASMNVGGSDVLGDSFSGASETPDNQAATPPIQLPQNNPANPQQLDLSNLPQEPPKDDLMSKLGGLFGNKKEDNAMASITEAADQYKLQEQNVAAQNAGMDRSLEYRGVPQQQNLMRGGRGNMTFRR